jgi:lipopolysaccharide export LptBFGC system permease protein LptF
MRAKNRTNARAYNERAFVLMLVILILGVLILLDGVLGLFSNESFPPLFKVILGPMCIFLVFLLVLTHHIEMQARQDEKMT